MSRKNYNEPYEDELDRMRARRKNPFRQDKGSDLKRTGMMILMK